MAAAAIQRIFCHLIYVLFIVKLASTQPHDYIGFTCHANSTLAGCSTIFPRLCSNGSECIMWEYGLLPSKSVEADNTCKTVAMEEGCTTFRKGQFSHGIWTLKGCNSIEPSSAELHSHLTGRHILFIGNSMVRQIFIRLVWFVRGIDDVIEHYFHHSAFYASNATHDHLHIGDAYKKSRSSIVNPTFVAEYIWGEGNNFFKEDKKYPADLRVAGYSYYGFNDTELLSGMKLTNTGSTLFLTMPMVHWKVNERNNGDLIVINKWIENNQKYHSSIRNG